MGELVKMGDKEHVICRLRSDKYASWYNCFITIFQFLDPSPNSQMTFYPKDFHLIHSSK